MRDVILTQLVDILGDSLFLVSAYAVGFSIAVMFAIKVYNFIYQSLVE